VIKLSDLLMRAGDFTLQVDDLEVREGEYFVVMGPSGAGKTLLLETIAGFRRIVRGRIVVGGRDVTDEPPEKRGVSLVPQDYALWPHMTTFDNIAYGLRVRGVPRDEVERRVRDIARVMGIEGLLDRRPPTLSGGEQQRVALARALVVEPRAVLLDEPLSNLDAGTRERLRRFLREVHEELGFTAIHVTHDPMEAAELGDRIAIMLDGKIVQVGGPEEVIQSPVSVEAAMLHGAPILIKGTVAECSEGLVKLEAGDASIVAVADERCSPGDLALVLIRPEDVALFLDPPKTGTHSIRNVLRCTVSEIRKRGPLAMIDLQAGGLKLTAVITRGSLEHLGLKPGDEVYASFKAASARVLSCRARR